MKSTDRQEVNETLYILSFIIFIIILFVFVGSVWPISSS